MQERTQQELTTLENQIEMAYFSIMQTTMSMGKLAGKGKVNNSLSSPVNDVSCCNRKG